MNHVLYIQQAYNAPIHRFTRPVRHKHVKIDIFLQKIRQINTTAIASSEKLK